MKRTRFFAYVLSILVLATALPASASISNWETAASIEPKSTTDFSTASFRQSVQNLKATGANSVSLIIPYHTSNCQSSNVEAGWNTPTDSSLTSAISYIRSLSMRVILVPHLDAYDNWGGFCAWRANISPSDRSTFFANYQSMLDHLASFNPDVMTIGVELISVSSSKINADNTTRWNSMISHLRANHPGINLNYSANWGSGDFATETNQIQFWGNLDSIGISGYYELPSATPQVADIESEWNRWNTGNIKPLVDQYGKSVKFTEVGYESVNGARYQPWDSNRRWWAGYNGQEQANLYEAMFRYWNNYDYFTGVNLWDWSADPNAGGDGDTDYTPQNKPAQAVIASYFGGSGTVTPPPTNASFSVNSNITPAQPTKNQNITANTSVMSSSNASNIIVDLEIRDANNNKVMQQFFENQNFTGNTPKSYSLSWTPTNSGKYTLAVGIFSANWTQNFLWEGNAASFTVSDDNGGTNPPPTSGNINIWWPTNGTSVTGTQPFKAELSGFDLSQYQMYWQVDGDGLNLMNNSSTDWPHKESLVDLSGWNWKADNNYQINFVAKDMSGNIIAQKSITIHVTH